MQSEGWKLLASPEGRRRALVDVEQTLQELVRMLAGLGRVVAEHAGRRGAHHVLELGHLDHLLGFAAIHRIPPWNVVTCCATSPRRYLSYRFLSNRVSI